MDGTTAGREPWACDGTTAAGREPWACDAWSEVFISHFDAAACGSTAESLVCGHSLLLIHGMATNDECQTLHEATATKGKTIREGRARSEPSGGLSATLACRLEQPCVPTCTDGRIRFPVATFHRAIREMCDELLLRALEQVDASLPELRDALGPGLAATLRAAELPVATSPLLTFTHNEPAINLYSASGSFEAHRDLQALTVLMPLVGPDTFGGGGTAFWRALPSPPGLEGTPSDAVERDVAAAPPALVLKPPAGTALLWAGNVTHAGQQVTAGLRSVFVASCSRRW